MTIKHKLTRAAVAVSFALGANLAHSAALEEVIVTAQKRTESWANDPPSMVAKLNKPVSITLKTYRHLFPIYNSLKTRLLLVLYCAVLAQAPTNHLSNQ